jgi:hypothetical protein
VAQSDAQTFTGHEATCVVAQSDAQAFYTFKRANHDNPKSQGCCQFGDIFAGESPGPVPQRRTQLGNGAGRSGVGAALVGN